VALVPEIERHDITIDPQTAYRYIVKCSACGLLRSGRTRHDAMDIAWQHLKDMIASEEALAKELRQSNDKVQQRDRKSLQIQVNELTEEHNESR
jgi:hypothetical protein